MWRRRDNDPEIDADLVQRLESDARSLQPGHLDEGRELLLRALAAHRVTPAVKEERPMLDLLFGKKRLALAAVGVIALGAAGAVGASGGVQDAAGNVNSVLAALNITDNTPDVADEHLDAITADDVDEGLEDEEVGAEDADENASEGAQNADDGINNSNASETGLENAADEAFEGSGNADGATNTLPDAAQDHTDALPELAPPADTGDDDDSDEMPVPALPDAAGDPPVPSP